MKLDWNVVATSRGGHEYALLSAIGDLGWFESSSAKDVIVGLVDDRAEFLEKLSERLGHDDRIPASLGHVMPVARTVLLEGDPATKPLEDAVAELAGEIGGRSYHVRVDVHGHKGVIHGHHVELLLADVLWDALCRAGHAPRVVFDDPDVVVQVEVLGDRAGVAIVDRRMRERFPFLRVR